MAKENLRTVDPMPSVYELHEYKTELAFKYAFLIHSMLVLRFYPCKELRVQCIIIMYTFRFLLLVKILYSTKLLNNKN